MIIPSSRAPLKLNSKFILPIGMLFVMASTAAAAVSYKIVPVKFGGLISGATIIFPITYILGDVVTEVYGYDTNKILIWWGLICEVIFALLVYIVSNLPIVNSFLFQYDYVHVFQNIIKFVAAGIFADLVSDFINGYIISKWKIYLKGRLFWMRSILSTVFSQLIQSILLFPFAFYMMPKKEDLYNLMISGYLVEVGYSFLFVPFACILVYLLKRYDHYDAYDTDVKYNPLRF